MTPESWCVRMYQAMLFIALCLIPPLFLQRTMTNGVKRGGDFIRNLTKIHSFVLNYTYCDRYLFHLDFLNRKMLRHLASSMLLMCAREFSSGFEVHGDLWERHSNNNNNYNSST